MAELVQNKSVLPERRNPTCLRPGSGGRANRVVTSDAGNIVIGLLHFVQHATSHQSTRFRLSGQSTGGALTRAELTSRSAARSASEYLISLCTATLPKVTRLEGEQEGPQTRPINSGSCLAGSRRTRRSVKTRADKQSSICASGSQGHTRIKAGIWIDRGRPNYPF